MQKTYTYAAFGVCLMFGLSFGCRQEAEKPDADETKTAAEQELAKLKGAAKESIQNQLQPPLPATGVQGGTAGPKTMRPPAEPRPGQNPGAVQRLRPLPRRPGQPGPRPGRGATLPPVRPAFENVTLPSKPTPAELAKRKAAAQAEAKVKDMEARQKALDEAAKKKAAEKKPAGEK